MGSQVSNSQIAIFRDTGSLYLRNVKDKTKAFYAVDKMVKKLKPLHEQFIDDQGDIRTDRASTDPETKVVLKSGDGYQFDKENDKLVRKEIRALFNKSILIEPHFVSGEDIPKDLSFKYEGNDGKMYTISDYEVRSAFEGIVITTEEQ